MDYLQRWRFALAVPLQFLAALLLLRYACPIYWDGGGPMPSFFYFGPFPSIAEYYRNEWQYDARFLFPYLVASAFLVAVTLVIAPKAASLIDSRRTTVFIFALGVPLAVAAMWDAIRTVCRLAVPVFFSFTLGSIRFFLLVLVPLAVLAAAFAGRDTEP